MNTSPQIPALDPQTATEVTAHFFASLVGHHVTWHGDDFQVSATHIRRDSLGWPYAVDLTLADHSRGDSIRVYVPVEATPIGA